MISSITAFMLGLFLPSLTIKFCFRQNTYNCQHCFNLCILLYIVKNFIITKSGEDSDFVLSNLNFSRYMNNGKCFALFESNVRCLVRNIWYK